MKSSPALLATIYLFFAVFGLLLGGLFPMPSAEAVFLLFVSGIYFFHRRSFEKERSALSLAVMPKKASLPLLLLFPVFEFATLSISYISLLLLSPLGVQAPAIPPSLPLFLGAVLFVPVAEELFFRHFLFHTLSPYGKGKTVLLTALLFALTHASLIEIPYAFVAGLFLGYVRAQSEAVLLPLLFHFLHNLLAFFAFPSYVLLPLFGVLSLLSLLLLLLRFRPSPLPKAKEHLSARTLSPLLAFVLLMLALTVFSEVFS